MEEVLVRFPLVAQQFFEQLDNESLTNTRIVSKSWLRFVDDLKFPMIRKIEKVVDTPDMDWQRVFRYLISFIYRGFPLQGVEKPTLLPDKVNPFRPG